MTPAGLKVKRAALWAVCATALLAASEGQAVELPQAAEDAAQRLRDAPPSELGELVVRYADFNHYSPDALRLFATTLEARGETDRLASFALTMRCRARILSGQSESAESACKQALKRAARSADVSALLASNRNLGSVEVERGDYENGVPRWLASVDYARHLNDKRAESSALSALGAAAVFSYAFEAATQYFEKAIEAAEQTGDSAIISIAHNQLAAFFVMTDRPGAAVPQFERAYNALRETDSPGNTVGMVVEIGRAQAIGRDGDPERALELMNQVSERYREIENPVYLGLYHHIFAEVCLALDRLDLALKNVNQAIELLEASPTRRRESFLLAGRIHRRRGECAEAVRVLETLLEGSKEPFVEESEALREQAGCLAEMDQPLIALAALERAHEAHDLLDRKVSASRAEFLQARFNAALLERDIESMRSSAERQRTLRNVITVAALLMLVILVLVFRLQLSHRKFETERERTYRLETIGRLTGGVAHDFNNVLTVIMHGLSLIQRKVDDNEEVKLLVSEAQTAAASGAGIVQQLLSFARRRPQAPQVVGVALLLEEVAPLLRRTVGESMRLKFAPPSAELLIRVDPSQLIAALINLVANSRDAMEGKGEIIVGASETDEWVKLYVTDRGHGIAEEDQARIFDPFFTTKGPEKGSGIGLSMVYGFVKESGGTVSVESTTGSGTTIALIFPRSQPE
ncbi:MAG: ATP-binding protein [Myxococcota bacterium]